MKNMEIWGTPDFKSNSSTVAAACMFHRIHSVGYKKTINRCYEYMGLFIFD